MKTMAETARSPGKARSFSKTAAASFLTLALAVAATPFAEACTTAACLCTGKADGLYANPNDVTCTTFIQCYNNGKSVVIQPCGAGTVFNPTPKVCDWPYNYKCPGGGASKPPSPSPSPSTKPPSPPPSPSTKPQGLVNACGTSFGTASCTNRCPSGLDRECPSGQRCFASVSCDGGGGGGSACTTPISGRKGTCLNINDCAGGTFNDLCPTGSLCCVPESPAGSFTPVISRSAFNEAFNSISGIRSDAMYAHFNRALQEGGISTCLCRAAFMAQVSHESGGLRYFEEIASGEAYEGVAAYGNTQPGDGKRYKGRGPIQLTGRYNYGTTGSRLGLNLVGDPEMVCLPSVGWRTTVDYWRTQNLNNYCKTGTDAEFIELTRKINGGTNGLADRQALFARIRRVLGC